MRVLSAAVVSADPEFILTIRDSDAVAVAVEFPVGAPEMGVEELESLHARRPDVVILDVGDSPELSFRLVEFLAESAPGRPVLVIGPTPSADLLIEAMRAGAAEYLQSPPTEEVLRDALGRITRRLGLTQEPDPQRQGRIYTFVGVKGGVGATMIASNVAVELHRLTGEKVLLVDFDFGLGDAAVHLGLTPRFHVVDVIENLHRMDPGLLTSFVESYGSGLHLLASPGEAEKIASVEPEQVTDVLRFLRKQYAYTIVDAPDPYAPYARSILAESDRVLLVATPEVPALRNVERVLPLLDANPASVQRAVSLIVNRFVSSRSVPVEEIQRLVGAQVQRVITNDYEPVTRSINEGRPIVGSKSAVARDLEKLAADLAEQQSAARPTRPGAGARLLRSLTGWGRDSAQEQTAERNNRGK